MKIALVTDTHFGARNDNQNFNDFFFKFYENVFFPYLIEHKITTCVHLGDVMDRRKYVSYKIATDFRKRFLGKFEALNIDLHLIVGNHDTYYKNTSEVNSMEELGGYGAVYKKPQIVEFDGLPILLVPWINADNYEESLKALTTANADVLMGHLEINGFAMNSNTITMQGAWDKEHFKRFETVFSGHFHHKSDDGQIYYLGTPYEIYWNDYNDPKGFHVYDTATRELERIVNPYTLYEKIYYDDSEEDYTKHDVSKYKEKYVKLIVVNKKDLFGFDKFTDRLLKTDTYDLKIIEDFSDLDASNVSDDIVENSGDTMTLLDNYIDELSVDLDKDRLKKKMKEVYLEAQDLEL